MAFKSVVADVAEQGEQGKGKSDTWAAFIPNQWIEASVIEISSKEAEWRSQVSDSKKNRKKKKQ